MIRNTLVLGAITALSLAAHAQVFNWTLTTADISSGTPPGNGSGQLTLTAGIITDISGTVGLQNVTLLPVGTLFGEGSVAADNVLPITGNGIAFQVSGGNYSIFDNGGGNLGWELADGTGNTLGFGTATFTYSPVPPAPVPEPSAWATGAVFGVGALVTAAMKRRGPTSRA